MCKEQKERGDQCGWRGENWEMGPEHRYCPWDLRAMASAFDLLLSEMESWEGPVQRETRLHRGCLARADAETSDDSSRPGSGLRDTGPRA